MCEHQSSVSPPACNQASSDPNFPSSLTISLHFVLTHTQKQESFYFTKPIFSLGYPWKGQTPTHFWTLARFLPSFRMPSRDYPNFTLFFSRYSSLFTFSVQFFLTKSALALSFLWAMFISVVPNLLGTMDQFHGRQFFHGLGGGGWFLENSSLLYLLCTLFLLLLYCTV